MKRLCLNTLCLLFLALGPVEAETNSRVAAGKMLYATHCARCHGENGEGRRQGNATSLNNQDFLATVSDGFLRETIARGRRGTEMAGFWTENRGPLTSQQVGDVIAFLRSWQKEPARKLRRSKREGSPERGAKLYIGNCANCHGREGGGELGMGPALNNQDFLKAASESFLWETIARGRRDTPMFASLKGLSGVRQLSKQDIDDLVAFIRTWDKSAARR